MWLLSRHIGFISSSGAPQSHAGERYEQARKQRSASSTATAPCNARVAGPLVIRHADISGQQPSRIGHLSGRSLYGNALARMFPTMSARLFTRQIVTLVLALGVFLSGAAPSWAMPVMWGKGSMPSDMSMTMPDMTMQNSGLGTSEHGTPSKNAPCKSSDGSCTVCTACALPIVLVQDSSPIRLLDSGDEAVFAQDVNHNGIAVLPALPPPILRS